VHHYWDWRIGTNRFPTHSALSDNATPLVHLEVLEEIGIVALVVTASLEEAQQESVLLETHQRSGAPLRSGSINAQTNASPA